MQIPLPSSETLLKPDASGSLFILLFPPLSWGSAVPCWHTALSAHLLPWMGFGFFCGSCFWTPPTNCTAQISHPSLSLGAGEGDGVCSSRFILERLWLVVHKGTWAGTGWDHPEPSPWGPVGGSSKAAGNMGSKREFGFTASAQDCCRGVLGADHCC